ncbi:TetR/AcrR family transcriptional regulator [Streptomyces xantholiticus]|uniref:TetR/AcrR family transcriptional regulator n=1 Tax=Streptomyces xantholiticus TaxID=68285 RepID=UPI001672E2B8|nr:TetR/AcrR family transcriptional regulator [Streptomyces xantholiticus]GGW53909.1 TetR family transcriptional regulator [Streptomyces xantholiticus]
MAGNGRKRDPGGTRTRTGLPASIEAAWGLRERPGKGPKPGIGVERIVAAAMALASAEGLAAVSMGRVAKELGVSTMSLYRYVAAKDELYVLMQEAAVGLPPAPPPPGTGWREALSAWARARREVFHRNLWMLRIPVCGPPATPNSVAWWDRGLAALADTGLDGAEKISVIMLIGGFVRNEALVVGDVGAAVAASGEAPEVVMRRYAETLERFADPERYPALAEVLRSRVMYEPDGKDFEFVFGLERLLDGVGALVDRRARDEEAAGKEGEET